MRKLLLLTIVSVFLSCSIDMGDTNILGTWKVKKVGEEKNLKVTSSVQQKASDYSYLQAMDGGTFTFTRGSARAKLSFKVDDVSYKCDITGKILSYQESKTKKSREISITQKPSGQFVSSLYVGDKVSEQQATKVTGDSPAHNKYKIKYNLDTNEVIIIWGGYAFSCIK